MNQQKPIAALFDFDGVIMDTEGQYTKFWNVKGEMYHPEIPNFGHHIKGQTLMQLYEKYFLHIPGLQDRITEELNRYENEMKFEFIPGVVGFMKELRSKGVKMAIVTSSNDKKMANAYRAHPELLTMVDEILTADRFTHSKPHPECFLLGAEVLDTEIGNCIVFEDSYHGLEAGNRAGMKVVGLATTNPAEAIADKCAMVITDFTEFSFEKMTGILKQSR